MPADRRVAGAVDAWLREQDREKRTCGRCAHYQRRIEGDLDCEFNTAIDSWGPDESCSRFEERSDG